MKKTALLICLAATAAASAETISLEVSNNPAFRQYSANAKVDSAFKSIQNGCGDFGVAPISLSPKKDAKYFVAVCVMGGSASTEFQILSSKHGKSKVLLEDGGYGINILPQQHNGLHDIAVTEGNARYCTETRYRFNGKTYRPYKRKSCMG
jgi:hypothetical protein